MDEQLAQQLCEMAISARKSAYAPYSNFAVGAALLCVDGEIYEGCNVENGVFGLSICAERVAICKAVSDGKNDFKAIAIAANPLASPCGSCRQFMLEFSSDLIVLSCDSQNPNQLQRWSISELLPDGFKFPQK